jgi:penicillin-insensitive murein endopeptidase
LRPPRSRSTCTSSTSRVIFDTDHLPRLFETPRAAYLKSNVNFLQRKPWVRHDEHYHVDFAIDCRPYPG